ncbi:ROK family transcriptional regulator [uncultured Alistipes sp.]|jgi:transcriptional regulator/sugar kinase|uniref:ROK family transcriptional regulator n=1 Tax=uncultured Alistipes sp. TaxID=538949 RepID=UPI0025FE9F41|nr:ROK family transcriptional regulator [uncultured Alistipes sp.]
MSNSFLKQAEEGNRTAILKQQIIGQYIFGGDFSITDLSKAMSLSVPTITKLINELIDEGFVHDFGKQGTNGGRRPNIYGLNPYAGYFVGVELKKDSVEMAVINFKGQIIERKEDRHPITGDTAETLDRFCDIIASFISKLNIPKEKILAVGVNVSGRVNSNTGYSYSYFFVEEQPLAILLEQRLGCTVYIENDTRAATYGEYMCGEGNNEKTMLYINASWGLGLGMILDGKLFYGKSGFSGEYGHFPLLDNEIICRCGKRGCLETGASGSAIHRIFLEKLREGRISMLSDKFNSGEEITLQDILSALQKEDVLAIEIMESVGHTLGKAIAGLINMFNPELIVVGGTLAIAKDYLMLPIKSAVNKYSLMLVSKDTAIKLSKLGEEAGVIGACLLARSKSLGLL